MKKKIFAVANIKGGSTKSTTVIHLADAIRRTGKSVLLVDMDPQGSVTDFCLPSATEEELSEKNVLSLLRGDATLGEVVWESESGLDVIPSVLDLAALDVVAVRDGKAIGRLKKALAESEYGYVLIDTPGSLSSELLSAIVASTEVLIPVTPSRWTAKSVSMVLGEIENAKERGSDPKPVIIPAMFGKSKRDEEILDSLRKLGKMRILSAIPKASAIQNRTESGELLQVGSAAYVAFEALASEVMKL